MKHPRSMWKFFPKLDVKDLEANNNVLEQIKEPDIENEAEANVLATKSTRSSETPKLDFGKKTATKPPPTLQYGNETMGNSRYPDRPRKLLEEWWKNHIPKPKTKNM